MTSANYFILFLNNIFSSIFSFLLLDLAQRSIRDGSVASCSRALLIQDFFSFLCTEVQNIPTLKCVHIVYEQIIK